MEAWEFSTTSWTDSAREGYPDRPPRSRRVLTTGEQLVDVGLVAGVEHDGVPRGAEGAVQRDRQLDDPEVGAEVAAGARH